MSKYIPNKKAYHVKKTSCEFLLGKGIKWTETSGEIAATVQTECFLTIGMHMYAAKDFYNVGNLEDTTFVTQLVNNRFLRAELVCQAIAKCCLSKSNLEASNMSLNIFDIECATTFMLTVVEGHEKGHSWIVDPLLDNSTIVKFSGTEKAGNNEGSMVGCTCDALAHFSLHDSVGSLVLVDIQGIIHSKTFSGRKTQAKILTLFDVMAHSTDKDKGLGDQGNAGIEDFKKQHVCNSICGALNLPALVAKECSNLESDDNDADIYCSCDKTASRNSLTSKNKELEESCTSSLSQDNK